MMATKMKEYRYYLSSGVDASIRVKITNVELAPSSTLSVDALNMGAMSLAAEPKTPANGRRASSSSTAPPSSSSTAPSPRLRAFKAPSLDRQLASDSEIRNSSISEIFVTAQIFTDGLPLHAMVISSKGPTKVSEATVYFSEWLSFPVKYRDLSRTSQLAITVWGVGWEPIGGTTVPFFSKQGVLRDGQLSLRLWKGVEADPSPLSATPFEVDNEWARQESFRLDKLREKFERKEISRNDWMDGVTDRRIARIRRGAEPPGRKDLMGPFCSYRDDAVLVIEMPYFGDVVVYEEEPYSQRNNSSSQYAKELQMQGVNGVTSALSGGTNAAISGMASAGAIPAMSAPTVYGADAYAAIHESMRSETLAGGWTSPIVVWDPDLNFENPSERKYRKLARDILRGSIDPNLKPSREEKAKIELLLANIADNLKDEDKDLLWKFRYTLTDNKKAVVKFLLSVDWNDETEVKQATDLLHQWCEIDIADALKLLGRDKEFKHEVVRNFAVSTLARAKNEELQDFLLQLVQALRYEKFTHAVAPSGRTRGGDDETSSTDGQMMIEAQGPLARFLIERSGTNFQMANYFYWYLKVEASNLSRDSEIFETVLKQMLNVLQRDPDKKPIYDMLMAERDLMDKILAYHNTARAERGRKDQKEEKFRHLLKQFPWQKNVVIRMPLDPGIHLSGIVPSSAKMFKSAMYPAVIEFQTVLPVEHPHGNHATHARHNLADSRLGASNNNMLLRGSNDSILDNDLGSSQVSHLAESNLLRESLSTRVLHYMNRDKEGPSCKVMVKNGDDLRQDQLIMQMFILMDRLLKRVNLDLELTPYRILATGATDGLMEFVQDSHAVGAIVSKYESPQILSFLRTHNPDPRAEYGVAPEAMNRYVKSLAGYCVLTYILGIGDRHLDNVMMKTRGNLFHIDFGFIFGADPKPYPPPFKLTKEMVEGMGGPQSEHYLKFKRYCCQAYNWLRKSADLILNLLSLMADCGIEQLSTDPETTLQGVQEKFRLDLSDEHAEQFFLTLISDSVSALFPVLVEYIHKIATKLK